jgi:hypothetical protein
MLLGREALQVTWTFPKILPVPTGLVQIKFSNAKTHQVQLGGEITYFKLISDFRLQRKLQTPMTD